MRAAGGLDRCGAVMEEPTPPPKYEFPPMLAGLVKDCEKACVAAAAKGAVAPGHAFTDAKAEATRIMRDTGHPEHESYIRGDAGTVRKVMGLLGSGG